MGQLHWHWRHQHCGLEPSWIISQSSCSWEEFLSFWILKEPNLFQSSILKVLLLQSAVFNYWRKNAALRSSDFSYFIRRIFSSMNRWLWFLKWCKNQNFLWIKLSNILRNELMWHQNMYLYNQYKFVFNKIYFLYITLF